ILKNIFLKLISLLLAVLAWIYVDNEISKSKEENKITVIWDKEWNLEIRDFPVKANIKGNPPVGYNLLESRIIINPERCSVVGKKAALDNIEFIETEPIDVRKLIKSVTLNVSLRPLSNVSITKEEVEVIIPVEKGGH
ncbi:MAG: YbbR-like domain-containing protein, partial [Candidatus Omnitrophica bacterium]|nr:YbbR-like domain-containing protein [Candidatus Omnitrophota bacterium]